MQNASPTIHLVHDDLPAGLQFTSGMVALDTETTGLSLEKDKLCLVQVGDGEGNVWLVKFNPQTATYTAPNLKSLLENPRLTKLFHYARFDLAMLQKHLSLGDIGPVFCTKIASKLVRTSESKHNLRALVAEYAHVQLDKTEQMSNWAAETLTESQQAYAASDVLYLHTIATKLQEQLAEKGLTYAMDQALKFLSTRVALDLQGFPEADLFAHH